MRRIKTFSFLAAAFLSLLLPGCSLHQPQAVVPPVGPAPASPTSHDSDGYLVVYSAWSNFVDQGSTAHHSRYTITADNRAMPRQIVNHADRFDEGPIHLPLPPGSYHVKARSAHFGRVTVPVIIRPRQTTFVYLDGSSHANVPSAPQISAVKLPDGEIVGWAANTANHSAN